jgi:hypothetical protein
MYDKRPKKAQYDLAKLGLHERNGVRGTKDTRYMTVSTYN